MTDEQIDIAKLIKAHVDAINAAISEARRLGVVSEVEDEMKNGYCQLSVKFEFQNYPIINKPSFE